MKRIRIAFIAHNCRVGGSQVIAHNFLRVLPELLGEEQFLVIVPSGYGFEEIPEIPGSERFYYRGSHRPLPRFWFEQVTLPRLIKEYRPDVIFGGGNIGISHPAAPQAIFIHTPYPFYDRRHYPGIPPLDGFRIRCLDGQIRKCLRKTRLVFVQSPIMRQRISERMGYPIDRIRLVRFPPPAELGGAPEDKSVSRESSDGRYRVLVLTRYLTHRNPTMLIPFCQRWKQELLDRNIQFLITINPDDHPHAQRFLCDLRASDLEEVIHNLGGLSREEVKTAFSRSDLLLFPSLMETLGMPYLEAMVMGVPILTTDLDFAHYVCGDAAAYYNPWDLNSLREKLFWLQDHPEASRQLAQNGRAELMDGKKFARDWKDSATEIFGHLRSLVQE